MENRMLLTSEPKRSRGKTRPVVWPREVPRGGAEKTCPEGSEVPRAELPAQRSCPEERPRGVDQGKLLGEAAQGSCSGELQRGAAHGRCFRELLIEVASGERLREAA